VGKVLFTCANLVCGGKPKVARFESQRVKYIQKCDISKYDINNTIFRRREYIGVKRDEDEIEEPAYNGTGAINKRLFGKTFDFFNHSATNIAKKLKFIGKFPMLILIT
jgi:hypothetical protein